MLPRQFLFWLNAGYTLFMLVKCRFMLVEHFVCWLNAGLLVGGWFVLLDAALCWFIMVRCWLKVGLCWLDVGLCKPVLLVRSAGKNNSLKLFSSSC